jgi:hypothetical protein
MPEESEINKIISASDENPNIAKDPILSQIKPPDHHKYFFHIIIGIIIIILFIGISFLSYQTFTATTTSTTIRTTTTTTTTTTTSTTTTTTAIPVYVKIFGLGNGTLSFYHELDVYTSEFIETRYSGEYYYIAYNEMCKNYEPVYEDAQLRYISTNKSIKRFFDIEENYCQSGTIDVILE